jgi:phosphoglycerol transferase MdoB-like AlkP superfamily enzyme
MFSLTLQKLRQRKPFRSRPGSPEERRVTFLRPNSKSVSAFFQPSYKRELAVLFILYLLIQIPYIVVVFYKHEFDILDPTVALYFLEKTVFDFAVFFSINACILRLLKSRFVALLFSIFYFLLILVNTAIYFFGSTLLEKHHFSLITPYSIAGFIDVEIIGGAVLLVLVCAVLWFPIRRLSPQVTWRTVFYWSIFTIAMGGINIPQRIASLKKSDERFDKRVMVFRNAQLDYSAQNPITALMNNIILPSISEDLYSLKGSKIYRRYMKKYFFIPETYTVTDDISQVKEIAKKFHISIGERKYPDLGLKKFKRIVIVFVESLSLEMLQCYNDKLDVPTSRFLCSSAIRDKTFQNLRTSAEPTLQGLMVTFFSHPNYEIQSPTGFRNSPFGILKKEGFHTIFIRSASKFFADENITFKRWGLEKIIAREDFYERPDLRKYIYGWGLEDRILYDEVVNYIDKRRDEKLLVLVLGTDTHPPHGKRVYRYLDYPHLPPGFGSSYGYARDFLKAVYNTDHDLKRFIEQLKEKNLFTDDTLVILTADHSCPPNNVTKKIPGYPRDDLNTIPLVFLSPQTLPAINTDILTSQIDILPTLFHLMGLRIPRGWWGDSLFSNDKKDAAVGFNQGMVRFENNYHDLLFDIKTPNNETERAFKNLFSTVLVEK